jgi:hypothetical protein
MESEPTEDAELLDAIQTFADAFRPGHDNSTALDLLDRAIRIAEESGDIETADHLKASKTEMQGYFVRLPFVRLPFGPQDEGGGVREPRRPLPSSDRGSAQRLKIQNGFDSPAP